MSNQIQDFNNQATARKSSLLTVANLSNNLWSALNNARNGDEWEMTRSVLLAVSDILGYIGTPPKGVEPNPIQKKLSGISHLIEAPLILHRLIVNLEKYWNYRDFNEVQDTNGNKVTYNNGFIPMSNILDIVADTTTLSKKLAQGIEAFRKVTKLVTPPSVALDIIAALIAAVSNNINNYVLTYREILNVHKDYINLTDEEKDKLKLEWETKNYAIHKDEFSFGEVFGEAFKATLTNWGTLTAVLEQVLGNIVPDGLNPFETPNDIDLIGTNNNDVIDADSWFDDAYRIYGNGGNDTLIGGDHNDKILGGTGNDIIDGKEGNDRLDGGSGKDKLYGRSGDDYLNGGVDNDTLNGGKGNDTLVDESGYDHYYIEGRDIIHDLDGEGRLYLNKYDLSKFEFKFEGKNLWRATHAGKALFQATRDNDDLIIQSLTGQNDSVLIVDYFNRSKQTAQHFIGLDLKLNKHDKDYDFSTAPTNTLPNLYNIVYMGGYQGKQGFIGGHRADIFFAPNDYAVLIDAKAGNDRIYATTQADILKSGDGHDMIFGSSPFYENSESSKQPKNDHDIIYGNAGNDKIFGSARKDFLQDECNINTFCIKFSNSYL